MIDSLQLQREAADALVAVRQFGMAESVRSMVKLLNALESQYRADFENVTIENLVPLQIALKQVVALRQSITAEQHLDPKIL